MRIKASLFISLIIILLAFLVYRFYPQVSSPYFTAADLKQNTLSDQSILLNASSPALSVKQATVLTDNDSAFSQKLRMVQTAKESIDLAYYIYADDHSSSILSQALIAAVNRGVRVRLLVDYQSTYAHFDLFSMLEQYGNQGKGSLKVRFYNRPSLNIIKDAVFVTLGCSEVNLEKDLTTCSSDKYKAIEDQFSAQPAQPAQDDNDALLNYNNGKSGLFLSAFYAKNVNLMALAIQQGQSLPSTEALLAIAKTKATGKTTSTTEVTTESKQSDDLAKLKKLFTIYRTARHGTGLDRVTAALKLKFAMTFFGGKINPYYDALTSYLPIGHSQPRTEALKEWSYITDYLHQKLLLVDNSRFILGGRNVEDTYHMQAHPLMKHYQFMDTDISVELNNKENSLATAFERLWNFKSMVATTSDIEQHAPNDVVASIMQADQQCEALKEHPDKVYFEQCHASVAQYAIKKQYRIQQAYENMLTHASQYQQEYVKPDSPTSPSFTLDANAEIYYVENIPFEKNSMPLTRTFGAENGKEAHTGKYIHSLWLAALRNTCQQANAEQPQDVIIHNAYFFMPSNLLRQLGEMITGEQQCAHVHITILTNSADTTDLGIVNLGSKYSLKALLQHCATSKNTSQSKNAATLSYYEYQSSTLPHGIKPSLHSKVMVFGNDMFIGSANADIRSYMMDANNGLFIRQAPQLVSHYRQWFKQLLANQQRTQDKTQQLADSELATWLEEDTHKIISMIQHKMGQSAEQSPQQGAIATGLQKQLAPRLKALFETIHTLSVQSLSNKSDSDEAQEKFNALFKLI